MLVGEIQGKEGYGCDVLSFASEAHRDEFLRFAEPTVSTVERFIEVKGRGQSGPIHLEDNEFEAAKKHTSRFYLYRVFETADGQEWEVAVLSDPINHTVEVVYRIDLGHNADTEYWLASAADEIIEDQVSE